MALVVLEYADLCSDKDLSQEIMQAFGENSVGALAVRGIPNWQTMCGQTLPMSHSLAALPRDQLDALEDKTSMYNAGWSLGKEKMGDTPDFAKASFYFNPLLDDPSPEMREQYPWALPANRWPEETTLPHFRDNCREIGLEMKNIAVLLSKHIDRLLVSKIPGYHAGSFEEAMEQSNKVKARMLYYYPIEPSSTADIGIPMPKDNWIAWHNDSGFLTCLAGEIFVDHETGEVISNPEPDTAGLWIADREGSECKLSIPSDCMGIQVGECLQIISGGLLVATPHCVRGCQATPDVARISLPCFVGTPITFPLSVPEGCSREDVFRHTVSQKVPPLSGRWHRNGTPYGDFLGDTFKAYYEWATKDTGTSASASDDSKELSTYDEVDKEKGNADDCTQYVKILCFGDSLTEGLGGHRRHPYAIELEKSIDEKFKSEMKKSIVHQYGLSGECTDHMSHRLENLLESATESSSPYQVVCILAGTNDLSMGNPADDIFDRLKELYTKALLHGGENTLLVAITIPECSYCEPDFVSSRVTVNTLIKEYCTHLTSSRRQVVCVDLESALPYFDEEGNKDEVLWHDGSHMMPAGYDKFGRLVFSSIEDKLRSMYHEMPEDYSETSTYKPPPPSTSTPTPSLYVPPHRR